MEQHTNGRNDGEHDDRKSRRPPFLVSNCPPYSRK
jgi:hypothetical protein